MRIQLQIEGEIDETSKNCNFRLLDYSDYEGGRGCCVFNLWGSLENVKQQFLAFSLIKYKVQVPTMLKDLIGNLDLQAKEIERLKNGK